MSDLDCHRHVDSRINRRQYALRKLFMLTFVVSFLLAIVVTSFDVQFFRANPASVAWALAPIPIALILHWLRFTTPRAMALGSLILLALSLVVPAVCMDHESVFGWQALVLSFVFSMFLFAEWPPAEFQEFCVPVAGLAGTIANITFACAYIALLVRSYSVSCRLGVVAIAAALTAGGLIFACGLLQKAHGYGELEAYALYPGYGLWAASMLALWLGVRRHAKERPEDKSAMGRGG